MIIKKKKTEYSKQYRKENPEKLAAISVKYKNLKEKQTPILTEDEQKRIKQLYEMRNKLNENGVGFQVDHIQPLSKGGLHHPNNLQILSSSLNLQKNNKWPLTEDEQIKYKGIKI